MFLLGNITDYLSGLALFGAGAAAFYFYQRNREKTQQQALKEQQDLTLANAKREAETLIREAKLAANEEALKIREQTEKSFTLRRQELSDLENRQAERERLLNRQLETIVAQEKSLKQTDQNLQKQLEDLETQRVELHRLIQLEKEKLQAIAGITELDARTQLLKQVEADALKDANNLTRHILESAKTTAEDKARYVLSVAIQRYAGDHTFETTTATIALPGDEIKGRIIGREGRNIRAFEAATGITVLIDDTPNAVVLSGFDPVRREIAREAMQRLILDGRIHPTRIEEVVQKVTEEMDETIVKNGEEAVFKVGLPQLHPEIVKLLGRLRFRHSFSQNVLDHSIEVAHLMSLMASEMGINVQDAKRAGLLHDIGKAIDHEVEGSHAIIGADFIKRHGEAENIVNGVASHHSEVPHTNPLGVLVSAADAISASRPGARSETMTTYIKRLEDLERIGASFPGVEKCYAVQAGRELRVLVQPEKITDEEAYALAKSVTRKIEEELQYPGQIRVTVVRETRVVEFAK
ncbi:MAG: ribonuclease [Verrucomicrobia bacterium]|jgi:ribonuclease Y|nr:ribonuclease [Verrucomicrobiota bacterium]